MYENKYSNGYKTLEFEGRLDNVVAKMHFLLLTWLNFNLSPSSLHLKDPIQTDR